MTDFFHAHSNYVSILVPKEEESTDRKGGSDSGSGSDGDGGSDGDSDSDSDDRRADNANEQRSSDVSGHLFLGGEEMTQAQVDSALAGPVTGVTRDRRSGGGCVITGYWTRTDMQKEIDKIDQGGLRSLIGSTSHYTPCAASLIGSRGSATRITTIDQDDSHADGDEDEEEQPSQSQSQSSFHSVSPPNEPNSYRALRKYEREPLRQRKFPSSIGSPLITAAGRSACRTRSGSKGSNRSKTALVDDSGGRRPWSVEEEEALMNGVRKYGASGKWIKIRNDPHFRSALRHRDNVNIKDKYRNLLRAGRI